MKKFLRLVSLCAATILLCGYAAILPDVLPASAAEAKQRVFAASYFTMNNPHFIAWSEGLRSVIEANGDKLIDLDSQLDINKQLADVEDVLQQDLAAIFIAPVDSEGIKSAYLACQRAGVPIVNIDIPIPGDLASLCAFQVTTDNVMAGRVLGEAMIKHTGGEANVALIDWSINKAVTDRTEGFESAVANAPGIKIVTRLDAAASVESALPVMETMLQSNPEITAVFGINDPTCMGALSAIQAAKREGDIGIYSIDGSKEGLELVKEGKFVGTSAQFPFDMGVTAAQTAYKMLAGQPIEKTIRVKSVFVDSDNVGEFLK
jgi:ribose transport system substrate-binding protein